ncbi:DUF2958 domain-containing protein [Patescibacteria group bacterium]|uniref:DUF2958 domain-containing protein n=1 Tax=viral metagenome TaxID=1070528 RepID=A0A6M3X6J5_9ZZZZ|nr:DUF2958 domain-containing protein [Patescibacteria group bacterium]
MKLLTKELEKRFAEVGSQENEKDPIVIAKFFNPTGAGTWWATEYDDPVDKIFFGYASIFGDHNDEWGYVGLNEFEGYVGRFGLGIERDLHCGEKRISEFKIPSLVIDK